MLRPSQPGAFVAASAPWNGFAMAANGVQSRSAGTNSTSPSHSEDGDTAALLNTEDFSKLLDVIHTASQLTSGGKDISFPGICIAGGQATGKTSLLEALCGFPLPRGTGLVTRTPLEIALRRADVKSAELSYNVVKGDASTHVARHNIDFAAIPKEVEVATNLIAGTGKNVVDNPLRLRLFGPSLPTLDLIDLPGIVNNRTEDQPEDIQQTVEAMVRRYMAGEHMIIVCVIPASDATVNASVLALARESDPERKRTLGVFTKADTAPKGLRQRIEGEDPDEVALSLGYHAVKTRNTDNPREESMSPQQWHDSHSEVDWFSDHPELKDCKSVGSQMLAKELAKLLHDMLLKSGILSKLRHQIEAELSSIAEKQKALTVPLTSEIEAQIFVQRAFYEIAIDFNKLQIGRYNSLARNWPRNVQSRLHVPKQLQDMFDTFERQVYEDSAPSWYFTEACIQQTSHELDSRSGRGPTEEYLLIDMFPTMLEQHIKSDLKRHFCALVGDVRAYIQESLETLAEPIFEALPELHALIIRMLNDMTDEKADDALLAVCRLARSAIGIAPLRHPFWRDFLMVFRQQNCSGSGTSAKISEDSIRYYMETLGAPEQFITEITPHLAALNAEAAKDNGHLRLRMQLAVYTDIILRQAVDTIPRMVDLMLSTEVQEELAVDMFSRIQKEGVQLLPLMEHSKVAHRRQSLAENKAALLEAREKMNSVRRQEIS